MIQEGKTEKIAGVDEVGRGPLAGPVIAAAVILDPMQPIVGLKDSKALTALKREYFAVEIKEKAIAWAIGRSEVEEIDDINILQASLLAMQRAVEALNVLADRVLVDGKHCPRLTMLVKAIIGGDNIIPEISAASIVAKVFRDAEMQIYHEAHPYYNFAKNKGYGTAEHLAALDKYGICELHRKSFSPVSRCIKQVETI